MENVEAAAVGAHQQEIAVFKKRVHIVVANGKGVGRVVDKHLKTPSVEAVEAVFGAGPDETFPVLQHTSDVALRQAVPDAELFRLNLLGTQRLGGDKRRYDKYESRQVLRETHDAINNKSKSQEKCPKHFKNVVLANF